MKKPAPVAATLLTLALAAFTRVSAPAAPDPPLKDQLAAAEEASDAAAIAEICRRLLKKNPTHTGLLKRLASAEIAMSDSARAHRTVALLKPLVASGDRDLLELEGDLAAAAQKHDAALAAWEQANRIEPGNARVLAKLAQGYAGNRRNPVNAAHYYAELSKLRSVATDHIAVAEVAAALRDWAALIERTTTLKTKFAADRNAKQRIPAFERFIESSTRLCALDARVAMGGRDQLAAVLERGRLFYDIGFHDKAFEDGKRALKLAPDSLLVRFHYAVFASSRHTEHARIRAWGVRRERLKSKYASDDVFRTLATLEEAIEGNPESGEPYRARADFLLLRERQSLLALADAEKALKLDPKDGDALRLKARAQAMEGRFGAAQATIRAALEVQPEGQKTLAEGIDILMEQGDYEAAIELCDRLIAVHPESKYGRSQRRKCYARLQKPAPAANL